MSPELPRYGRLNLEAVVAQATETVLESGGHLPTLLVSGSEGNTVLVIDALAPTHDLRMQQMAMFGFAFGLSGRTGELHQIFLITEAWLSLRTQEQLPILPPSEDPNRKEMLIISSFDPTQDQRDYALFEMVRDSEGVIRELKNFLSDDATQISSDSPLLDAFVIGFNIGAGELG
jgi:hypothetical protein